MVKSPPFIGQDSVRQALDALIYSSSEKKPHLLSLLIVDEFLLDPHLPDISHSRQFALNRILTSLITSQLVQHRSVYLRQVLELDARREDILRELCLDSEHGSLELLGWSWLFHHYVLVHLNIHALEFCELAHIEERTLRRYQQRIIKRLADLLITQEWAARIRQHKRQLLTQLPTVSIVEPLLAREEVSSFVNQMVIDAQPPHFFIVGSHGVGKTAFVESILYTWINAGEVDQLVWIRAPSGINYIYYCLLEQLRLLDSRISLREYLLIHRTFIVLDDIDHLRNHLSELRPLLQILTPAIVFMTSSTPVVLPNVIEIALHPFSEHDARLFASRTLAATHVSGLAELIDREWQTIWQRVGGNPFALQLAIRTLPHPALNSSITANNSFDMEQVYRRIYEFLDDNARTAWIGLAILGKATIPLDELQGLWPRCFTRETVTILSNYGIIEVSSVPPICYQPVMASCRYIEYVCQRDLSIHILAQYLIEELDNYERKHDDFYITAIELFLLAEWINLDTATRKKWITNYWREGVKRHHCSVWNTLLKGHVASNIFDVDTRLGYAICLRSLGEWSLAEDILQKALLETGRKGQFIEQAHTMLQLAILLRYRGRYEKLLELLFRAEQISIRFKSDTLREAVAIEKLHVLIELEDLEASGQLIFELADTRESCLLKAEVYLLHGDLEQALTNAYLALQYCDNDLLFCAKVHTLMGRAYKQQNNDQAAKDYFSRALAYFERQDDMFLLARAQANLGAALIQSQQYDEATTLLEAAEKMQIQLGDHVSLSATRHNLQLVKIAFPIDQ